MNTRQVATGTLLTASLLLGGAGVADARPNTGAMDRGVVVRCDRLERRIDSLEDHLQRLDERKARLDAALADAQADGNERRIRHLEAHLAQVDRARTKLVSILDELRETYAEQCEAPPSS